MNDFKLALRQLSKNPMYAAVAILSLALGIGAGTAVFSILNAIVLRSLPLPNPQQLRVLQWTGVDPRIRSITGYYEMSGDRATAECVSPEMFKSLRRAGKEAADVFAFAPVDDAVIQLRDNAITAQGMIVSDNFFHGLQVHPVIGQFFASGGKGSGAGQQVVISFDWWNKYFSGARDVIGRTLTVNGSILEIIGVLPRDFHGIQPGKEFGFYVLLTPDSPFRDRAVSVADHWWLRLMARLNPGGSGARLKALLDAAFVPATESQLTHPEILVQPGGGGLAFDRKAYGKPLVLMLAVVGLVLTVACANVAGLSLARGAAREFDWSVRAALGAGRWRLIRQSFAESLVIALAGGILGILLAVWGRSAIARLIAQSSDGLAYDLKFDLAVLGFALATALIAAVLSGLFPALRAGFVDPVAGLKTRSSAGLPRLRIARGLVVAQVSLSLLLLAISGLYVRTLNNVRQIDAGFPTEKLLIFQLNAGRAGYQGAALSAYYDRAQTALASLPGVKSAGLTMFPLLENNFSSGGFRFVDRAADPALDPSTSRLVVSETFFDTMGIPMLKGRRLTWADTASAPGVTVVNETFTRKYFEGEDPIGHSIHLWGKDWRIVGVCRDAKYKNIKEDAPPTIYISFRQFALRDGAYIVLRSAIDPLALTASVRHAVASIDPAVPIAHLTTQTALIDGTIVRERLFAILCTGLAAFGLLLACIGLYGLMSYNIERRKKEIGIRMALGALPRSVTRSIVWEALLLTAIGIGAGLPVILAVTRLIQNQLYGISPNDPVTLAFVISTLIIVAAASAWIPARRAANTNPIEALRSE